MKHTIAIVLLFLSHAVVNSCDQTVEELLVRVNSGNIAIDAQLSLLPNTTITSDAHLQEMLRKTKADMVEANKIRSTKTNTPESQQELNRILAGQDDFLKSLECYRLAPIIKSKNQ